MIISKEDRQANIITEEIQLKQVSYFNCLESTIRAEWKLDGETLLRIEAPRHVNKHAFLGTAIIGQDRTYWVKTGLEKPKQLSVDALRN